MTLNVKYFCFVVLGSGDSGPTRSIIIRGTEDQINLAKQLIMEKVDEERNLRKNIDVATASRTPRRGGGHSPSSTPLVGPSVPPGNIGSAELALPIKQDGILEVFVSCVYHPNDFWIQGKNFILSSSIRKNLIFVNLA